MSNKTTRFRSTFQDLTGRRFGKLLVVEYSGLLNGRHVWLCLCSCGQSRISRTDNLTCGVTTECKSCAVEANKQRFLVDLSGKRFGRWHVQGECKQEKSKIHWLCNCDCGRVAFVRADVLKKGLSTQCKTCSVRTHNRSKTREYGIWTGMIQRCYNSKSACYKNYGGRGIEVCESWRKSFEIFIGDVGPRPSIHHTIERVDNDGNYEPGNVVWATRDEQAKNKRNIVRITYGNRVETLKVWSTETGIKVCTLRARLKKGWPVERVLFEPVKVK